MSARANRIPLERIEGLICLIRAQKMMLDSDLAALDGVATKVLNQTVKRKLMADPKTQPSAPKREIGFHTLRATSESRTKAKRNALTS